MKKNGVLNNRGFLLLETLLVSITIAGILTYIYVQYSSIQDSYHRLYRYNSVEGLYHAEAICNYLVIYADDTFYSEIDSNKVVQLTASNPHVTTTSIWSTLWSDLEIEDLYVMAKDTSLYNEIITQNATFGPFLKTLDSSSLSGDYLIVVKYTDNSFASVTFSKDSKVGE